ncbi:hypothetical protein [Aeromonas caviae]|uniref:hypothetical protein n=1 Tax=Aeromonas caviae TaxID=648 RepID=UPI003F7A9212
MGFHREASTSRPLGLRGITGKRSGAAAGEVRRQHRQPEGRAMVRGGPSSVATGYQEQLVIEIWVAAGEARRQHRQPEGRAMVRGGPSSRGHPAAAGRLEVESRAPTVGRVGFHREASTSRPLGLRGITGKRSGAAAGEARRQHRQPEGRAMVRGGPSSRGHPAAAGRLEVESRAPTVGRVGFHREASTSRPLGLRGITGKRSGVAAGEARRQHRQPEGRAMVRGGPSSVATGYQEQLVIKIWVAAGEARRQHRQPEGRAMVRGGPSSVATGYQEQLVIEIWVAAGEARRQHRQPEGRAMVRGGPSSVATGYQEQLVIEIWVAAGEARRQHRQPEGRAMVRGGPSSRGHPAAAGRLEVESRAPTVGRVGFHREASTSRPLGLRGITGKRSGAAAGEVRRQHRQPEGRAMVRGGPSSRGHPTAAGRLEGESRAPTVGRVGFHREASTSRPLGLRGITGKRSGAAAGEARRQHRQPEGRAMVRGGPSSVATGYQEQLVIKIWVAAGEARRQHRQPEGRAMVRGGPSSRGHPAAAGRLEVESRAPTVGRVGFHREASTSRPLGLRGITGKRSGVAAGEARRQHRQPEGRAMVRGGPSSVATGYQEQLVIKIWVAAGEARRQHRQPEGRAMVRGGPSSRGHPTAAGRLEGESRAPTVGRVGFHREASTSRPLGLRGITGKRSGLLLARLAASTGSPKGEPWCAAGRARAAIPQRQVAWRWNLGPRP